jgi:hypothetical protein
MFQSPPNVKCEVMISTPMVKGDLSQPHEPEHFFAIFDLPVSEPVKRGCEEVSIVTH